MNSRLSLFLTLTLMMAACSGQTGKSSTPAAADIKADNKADNKADAKAVQDFVQDFYNWYVPAAAKPGSNRPAELALRDRPAAFDPALARQLKEDSEAQAKVHDDIVGLDFDPFLSAQDPCQRYEVTKVQSKGESYLVDVLGVGGCEKHDAADVIAEVASQNGAWVFVNFHYPGPDSTDLLTVLKKLRDERH